MEQRVFWERQSPDWRQCERLGNRQSGDWRSRRRPEAWSKVAASCAALVDIEGHRRMPRETVKDGWYVDLDRRLYPTIYPQDLADGKRPPRGGHTYSSVRSSGSPDPPEIPEFIDIGDPETGFAVQEIQTSRSSSKLPDGSTRQTEGKYVTVVKLERGAYDTSLFEIPSRFKRVNHIDPNPKLS
jgi:hypothetical protein